MPHTPTPIRPGAALDCLNGRGFTAPTYTQVPNELFAAMPDLTDPQLRCLLIMVRWTLGYHRTTCTASVTDIQRETGLSRPCVIATLGRLHDSRMITRTRRYPKSLWRLNITEDTKIRIAEGQPTQKAEQRTLADW
jgi:hypothetical protein